MAITYRLVFTSKDTMDFLGEIVNAIPPNCGSFETKENIAARIATIKRLNSFAVVDIKAVQVNLLMLYANIDSDWDQFVPILFPLAPPEA